MSTERAPAARNSAPDPAPPLRTVRTSQRYAAEPLRVWQELLYYEQIDVPPPLLLRLLLPRALRTVGRKSNVGDEAVCEYDGGHLRKRVTEVVQGERYRFEVVEQDLPLGPTRLQGGCYDIRPLPGGGSELTLETRYLSGRRPASLWSPVEASVCHAFHRHILAAMGRAIAGPQRAEASHQSGDRGAQTG